MKPKRTLHPLLQRLAALVLLGVALGAGISAIAMPLAEAMAANREARARLVRFESMLQAPAESTDLYDPADLSVIQIDDAEAQVALQSVVDRLARGAGVAVQSVRPQAAEYMGDVGRSVWVELNLSCDLQALVDLLTDIDAEKPVLLVRRLDIQRGDGPRPDNFLRVRLEIGRAWRSAGDGA
ncbi:unnamed protein product [Phaeothamnion confervicola]